MAVLAMDVDCFSVLAKHDGALPALDPQQQIPKDGNTHLWSQNKQKQEGGKFVDILGYIGVSYIVSFIYNLYYIVRSYLKTRKENKQQYSKSKLK